MTLYMETTEISPEKTIMEIEELLMRYKASSIMKEFQDGKVSSLCFRIEKDGLSIPFRLPCRWEKILTMLCAKNKQFKRAWRKEEMNAIKQKFEAQARRVAWRQILRWIQAQFALIDTGMAKTEEAFMPYMQMPDGRTVFELVEEQKFSGFLLETKLEAR